MIHIKHNGRTIALLTVAEYMVLTVEQHAALIAHNGGLK